MRPSTTSFVLADFVNDAIFFGAPSGSPRLSIFGSQCSVATSSLPPGTSCDSVRSIGAPPAIGASSSRSKRSNVPKSVAVPFGKKLSGSNLSAAASCGLPASGPDLRVNDDTPMFGVANPPALSLVNSTPTWSGVTAANGFTARRLLDDFGEHAAPPSKPSPTKRGRGGSCRASVPRSPGPAGRSRRPSAARRLVAQREGQRSRDEPGIVDGSAGVRSANRTLWPGTSRSGRPSPWMCAAL